jgi:hypothetical protein
MLAQGYGVVSLHPFGLSYYNGVVGGLRGAERLGLELTYWNDPVDQTLLDRLAILAQPGATAALVPSLYPGQGILTTNRALARRKIVLKDTEEAGRAEWIVLSRRTAYWRPEFRDRLVHGQGKLVATRSRQGVWLSALWHFPSTRSVGGPPAARTGPNQAIRSPLQEGGTVRKAEQIKTRQCNNLGNSFLPSSRGADDS